MSPAYYRAKFEKESPDAEPGLIEIWVQDQLRADRMEEDEPRDEPYDHQYDCFERDR